MKKYERVQLDISFIPAEDIVRTSNGSWSEGSEQGNNYPWLKV